MYILFGRSNTLQYPSDVVWFMDLDAFTWTKLDSPPDVAYPQSRGGIAAVPVALPQRVGPDAGVMLFGGEVELSSTLGLSFKDAWAMGIEPVSNQVYTRETVGNTTATTTTSHSQTSTPRVTTTAVKSTTTKPASTTTKPTPTTTKAVATTTKAKTTTTSTKHSTTAWPSPTEQAHFYFQTVSMFPAERTETSGAYLLNRDVWVLHGGLSAGQGLLSDTWMLAYNATIDDGRPVWTRVISTDVDDDTAAQPDPRSGHAIVGIVPPSNSSLPCDDYVLMFGGRCSLANDGYCPQVWLFNFTEAMWHNLSVDLNQPHPTLRNYHVASALGPGRIVVHGGQGTLLSDTSRSVPLGDTWFCQLSDDMSTCHWSPVKVYNVTPAMQKGEQVASLENVASPPNRSHHVGSAMDCFTKECRQGRDLSWFVIFGGLLSSPFGKDSSTTGLQLANDTWALEWNEKDKVGRWIQVGLETWIELHVII
jgi:hypothetical protein